MQTFDIYRGYDTNLKARLAVGYSFAHAKSKAKYLALNANLHEIPYDVYQCSEITVRDALGRLRFKVNLRASA